MILKKEISLNQFKSLDFIQLDDKQVGIVIDKNRISLNGKAIPLKLIFNRIKKIYRNGKRIACRPHYQKPLLMKVKKYG